MKLPTITQMMYWLKTHGWFEENAFLFSTVLTKGFTHDAVILPRYFHNEEDKERLIYALKVIAQVERIEYAALVEEMAAEEF